MRIKTVLLSKGQVTFDERPTEVTTIPGVHLPAVDTYDNVCDPSFQKQVWEYLLDQVWYAVWNGLPTEMKLYKPNDWDIGWIDGNQSRKVGMHRCMFGSDEASISKRHPIIHELWVRLNEHLGNRYELTGAPEGMWWRDHPIPPCEDPDLPTGWRIYANATVHDQIGRGSYIHRDTADLTNPYTVTMIYCPVAEWYPSWGNEIMFYPEDPDRLTGDHQQFSNDQRRGFPIGWPDEGKLVCLRPNRLLVYDGRTLHSTQPSRHRHDAVMNRRVVFRASLKPEFRT